MARIARAMLVAIENRQQVSLLVPLDVSGEAPWRLLAGSGSLPPFVLRALAETHDEAAVASATRGTEAMRGTELGAETVGESAARQAAAAGLVAGVATDVPVYVEPLALPVHLVVAGAGHVGRAVARTGAFLGWQVTLIDDREELLADLHQEFDAVAAPDVRVLSGPYDSLIGGIPLDRRTFVVTVTPGHASDTAVLQALALRRESVDLPYVGMMGSRRRIRVEREALVAAGAPAAFLDRLRAPVGLDIGAESPEELALAIVSEMLLVLHGGTGRPLRAHQPGEAREDGCDEAVESQSAAFWRQLCLDLESDRPLVLATVVETRGSAPREAGARMVVYGDGGGYGSTGGGVGEVQVHERCLAALAAGRAELCHVDLTNDPTSGQGGICGGWQDVWIEPLA